MAIKSNRCFFLLGLLFFLSLVSSDTNLSIATDAISLTRSLSGNQTIVSKGGSFELGFFTPGSSSKYYIGTWYKKLPKQTVIWVANRERFISNPASAELKISEDGNLVLLDGSKIAVWSSNSSSSSSKSYVAVLLDTGNLVLRENQNSSTIIWQSFDHPTDTWVPESWIGMNKITGEYQNLTSWKNSEDPSPGYFSDSIDPGGTSEFFYRWNQSVIYFRSGLWTGQYFTSAPVLPDMKRTTLINLRYVDDDQRRYITCSLYNSSVITRTKMDVSGQIKTWVWVDSEQDWLLFWSQPLSQCEVFSVCGAYGICDQRSLPYCRCLQGFEPASARDWELSDMSSGCARRTRLNCGTNNTTDVKEDGFLMIPNVQLPVNSRSLQVSNAEECRTACLNNCSCTAYAYNSGCSFWNGELRNLQQLYDSEDGAGVLYLRLAASDVPDSRSKKKNVALIALVAALGALAILCVFLALAWGYKRRRIMRMREAVEGSLIPFTYADLRHITKNFSVRLGGGGFGSVFRGTLPDSTAVAVKKLEGLSQGEKQFRTEVCTLGLIQHYNLIRLRGFCSEGTKRLLVYEYMPNGSLDSHLFGWNSTILNWKVRYQIILGIARGLSYLHKKCRECIIHCDIKPENILLDSNFSPKVSDFGMAKLVGRDLSRVLTTMRGTIGYLAPEWISGLPITAKADVYSFGMMLFEFLSGRRNTTCSEDGIMVYFPILAADKVLEGEVLSLLDEKMHGDADVEEVRRVCKVACWCIQDCEAHRPSMGEVVQILEGVYDVNMPPVPRSLQDLIDNPELCTP